MPSKNVLMTHEKSRNRMREQKRNSVRSKLNKLDLQFGQFSRLRLCVSYIYMSEKRGKWSKKHFIVLGHPIWDNNSFIASNSLTSLSFSSLYAISPRIVQERE